MIRSLWRNLSGLGRERERSQWDLKEAEDKIRHLEQHTAIVEDQRHEMLERLCAAAAPLEVIRAQNESHPYTELSPDMLATIRGTTDMARQAVERANRTWTSWPRRGPDPEPPVPGDETEYIERGAL